MKIRIIVLLLMSISISSFAQIGIGTTLPDASAVLDMTSTTQGVLIPRMTTAQRTAITSPAIGLQVYDTDTNAVWLYNGATWIQGSGGAGKFIEGAASDIAYYDGRVGIGRNAFSTAHKLWVEGAKTTDGTNTVARFIGAYEGTGTNVSTYGATFDVENRGDGTISYGIASYNTVANKSTGVITVAEPTRSEVNNETGGTINFVYGNTSVINNNGTIGNFVMGNFINYSGTGSVANSYALFISNEFNKGTNENYSIFSASDAASYFNGNVGVGELNPQQKLHVSGVMRLEPQDSTTPPAGALGDLYASTDGKLFFHDGTGWKEVQLN